MKINIPSFTGNTHIQGKALIKLAKLTSGNDEQKAQETYTKLNKLSESSDYDLMIKLDSQDAIVISKLNPLTGDTIELAHNNNFVQGMKEAVKRLKTEDENMDLQQELFMSNLSKYRILSQMRNAK